MDISAEAAERLAATTEADAFGDDLAALLDDPRVDAVIVSLPEDTHVDAVVAACASGRPVMVEKPLALEIAAARKWWRRPPPPASISASPIPPGSCRSTSSGGTTYIEERSARW